MLRLAVEAFREAGVNVRGETSPLDPLAALEDALLRFTADEVVISTFEEGRSAWLEEGVVDAVRARFDGPVTHVVGAGRSWRGCLLAGDAGDVRGDVRDLLSLSWPLNGGIAPLPFVTRSTTRSAEGFASSRLGPTLPVAPASASVWQPTQPAEVKTAFPAVASPAAASRGRASSSAGSVVAASCVGLACTPVPATAAT